MSKVVIKDLILICIGCTLMTCFRNYLETDNPINSNVEIQIAADNYKVEDGYFKGVGKVGNRKFFLSGVVTKKQELMILKNNTDNFKVRLFNFEQSDIEPPRNKGEFNFKKFELSKQITKRVKFDRIEIIIDSKKSVVNLITTLRKRCINYFSKFPTALKFNASNLILGFDYKNQFSKDNYQALSKLGIIHMFCISGMHIVLIIGSLRKICSKFQLLTIESLNNILLILLPVYAIFVGSGTGVFRAVTLVLVSIISQKLHTSLSKTEIFGITLLIGLTLNPTCLLSLGGQLSYLLSFCLIYINKFNSIKQTMIINLITVPIICFNNYEFNTLIMFSNLIISPIFELIIFPITIVETLCFPILEKLILKLDMVILYFYRILQWISQIKIFNVTTGAIPEGGVIVLIYLVFKYIDEGRLEIIKKYLLLFLVFFVLNKFPLFGQVTFIDVGQGDSILFTTPIYRKVYMIDTGGKISFGKHQSMGRKTVEKSTIPFLKSQGITKLDYLFLTHQDADHIGDLDTFLSGFTVKKVYFGLGLNKNPRVARIIKNHRNVDFEELNPGTKFMIGDQKLKVLAPFKSGEGGNEDSLTMMIKINGYRWFFSGDLDRENEVKVMKYYNLRNIDYIKAGHHGSKTSSDPRFIKQVMPRMAFISAGVDNRYGHPHAETMKTFQQNSVKTMNTAQYGMINIKYDVFGNQKISGFLRGNNEYKTIKKTIKRRG